MFSRPIFSIAAAAVASLAAAATFDTKAQLAHPAIKSGRGLTSFHVCGNYCGPGYCNGGWEDESNCDDSAAPETWNSTGASCADSCCRAHDSCCGHDSDRSRCNTNIVKCLGQCDKMSLTCTIHGVPVAPVAIEAAMAIVENRCCSEPCPVPDHISKSSNDSSTLKIAAVVN